MQSLADVTTAELRRWRSDPVAFVNEVLVNPEDGSPFSLYSAQEAFLRRALTLTAEGRLPFPEVVFGAPKKSGKTATAAMATVYATLILGGRFAEAYVLANDLEQAAGRVFQAAARMVEASPMLAPVARITANRIEFPSRGSHPGDRFGLRIGGRVEPDDLGVRRAVGVHERAVDPVVGRDGAASDPQGGLPPDGDVRRVRGRVGAAGGHVQAGGRVL